MKKISFCTYGNTPALRHARNRLESWGYEVLPDPAPTASHLLLPVPTFDTESNVKGGGKLEDILPLLGENITVFGGNLDTLVQNKVDFLKDEYYLTENAAITAQCALKLVEIPQDAAVLIIGWGRIGKFLVGMLRERGVDVTAAVRKDADFAALTEQGCKAVYLDRLEPRQYGMIFNTAPAPVLDWADCRKNAVLIDLASKKGIAGENVRWLRGLPGVYAPETSGTLIAKTALRYALGKE